MHYKNGREAKNGDKVVLIPNYTGGIPCAGILYDAVPGNDCCNGRLAQCSQNDPYANLAECLHIDDLKSVTPTDVSAIPPSPAQPA